MTDVYQLPLSQLEVGHWYVGRGRNGNVGLWDGDCFLVIGQEGIRKSQTPPVWENHWVIKREPYFTEASGCFSPLSEINTAN